MSESQWGVVADEDLPDAPGPDPADKRPKERSEPQSDAAPVTLTLGLPKEVTTAITMVADRLERVALAMEENTKEVVKLVAEIRADREVDEVAPLTDEIRNAAQATATSHETLISALTSQGDDQKALSASLKTWSESIEQALLAPRTVRLERDKKGNPVGATSQVTLN